MAERTPGKSRANEQETGRVGGQSDALGPPPEKDGPPPEDGATRRRLLKAGVGLLAVGGAGYGFLQTRDEVVARTDGSTLDDVPDRSEFVFSWTGSELLTDEGFQAAVDEELGLVSIDSAGTALELFETIEAATAINPQETGAVSAFGALPSGPTTYAGLLFESDTEIETVENRLADRGHLRDTVEYRDQTLYLVETDRLVWELVLCHLGDGRYALGTRSELEDIIDIRAGDGSRINGLVIDGFDAASEGILKGGFVVPAAAFSDLDLPIGVGIADSIEYGSAAIVDGVLSVTFVAPDESVAEDLAQTLETLGRLDREDIAPEVGADSPLVEVILTLLGEIETEVDGRDVQATVAGGFRVPAVLLSYVVDQATIG